MPRFPQTAHAPEWTPERDARLIKLWGTNATVNQIAAILGGFDAFVDKGRSAVSGRAKKLKLPPRAPGVRKSGYLRSDDLRVQPYTPGKDPRPTQFGDK